MGFLFGSPHSTFQAQGPNQDFADRAQNNVYNTREAQNNFTSGLTVYNRPALAMQNALANQLNSQALGQGGPNPALSQLAQTTGQNIANQGALMASQRGIGSNPALAARQIGQQGSAIQQQAANQAATLAAQQQLASQQLAGGLYGQMLGQTSGALNAQAQNALANQGQFLQAQQAANSTNAQTAQQNAKTSGGLLGGLLGGIGSAFAGPLGGLVGKALGGGGGGAGFNMSDVPSAAPLSQQIGAFAFADGGQVPNGPQSSVGQFIASNYKAGGRVPGQAKVSGNSEKNDTVPALLSPKEIVLPRSVTMAPDASEKAKKFVEAILSRGGRA